MLLLLLIFFPHTQFSGADQHTPAGHPQTQGKARQVGSQAGGKPQPGALHALSRSRPPQLTWWRADAATSSLCHRASPSRCLAVTAAAPPPHARGCCPGARVSARCTGYSALPYGLGLPSRAINTEAGRKPEEKGAGANPFTSGEVLGGLGGPSQQGEAGPRGCKRERLSQLKSRWKNK